MLQLSVIIPTYGRPDKIVKCIESIPSVPFIEIIVVDDNGMGTPNQLITKKLLTGLTHIRYLPLKDNVGAALARNEGVKIANSKYVTFLDDDDYILSGKLVEKLRFMQEKEECDLCCSDMQISENGKLVGSSQKYFRGVTPLEVLENRNCWTPMMMFKKEFFFLIGGFSKVSYKQDITLLLKAHIHGADVRHFKHATFIHTIHEGEQITTGSRNKIDGDELVLKLEKKLFNQLRLTKKQQHSIAFQMARKQLRIDKFCNCRRFSLFKFWVSNILLKCSGGRSLLKSVKDFRVILGKRTSHI